MPRLTPCDPWNGWPEAEDRSGWHWVEDADGLRPVLWRGRDWPDPVDRECWRDGVVVLAPTDLAGGAYLGPVALDPAVRLRFRAAAGITALPALPGWLTSD